MHITFSIFKYCDEATNKIIEKIMVLAKKRVYLMKERDKKAQKVMSGEIFKYKENDGNRDNNPDDSQLTN